jgi:hypothetical protein
LSVGLTGGAGKDAGTLLASVDCCPFVVDGALFTLTGGKLTLFEIGLLLDCDCASVKVDDTVVLETCREPDDLLPFDEPIKY